MGTIIEKNEELKQELAILTKALELRDADSESRSQMINENLRTQNAELERQIEELTFMREQDQSELTKLEVELINLGSAN